MQMACTIKEEVCIAHAVPDWISNLFLHEVALTCYSIRNSRVLFLCKVHLGGWSQYEDHCKHASLVPTMEINWKKTFSWGKVKENSNEGCIGCLIFHSQNQIILCEILQGFARVFCLPALGCTSDPLQFISHLCRFHETFLLLEGFRHGLAWTA